MRPRKEAWVLLTPEAGTDGRRRRWGTRGQKDHGRGREGSSHTHTHPPGKRHEGAPAPMGHRAEVSRPERACLWYPARTGQSPSVSSRPPSHTANSMTHKRATEASPVKSTDGTSAKSNTSAFHKALFSSKQEKEEDPPQTGRQRLPITRVIKDSYSCMSRALAKHNHHHRQSTNVKDGQRSLADTSPKETERETAEKRKEEMRTSRVTGEMQI